MTDQTIMMIGGGIQHARTVQAAQHLGYRVLVTDRCPQAPCFEQADFTAVIDGRDVEGLVAFAALHQQKYNIRGVFTLTELVTSVAAVANALNLPGTSLFSAVKCQNKQLSKELWLADGVPTPPGRAVASLQEAETVFKELGAPALVKPIVGFGAVGIVTVDRVGDLAQHDFQSVPAILEARVTGSMHDVNAVFEADGTFSPLGCFDRYFDTQKRIESGANYPTQLTADYIEEAYRLTERAARALGISQGPVKADLVLSEDGLQILELAPRLHGPKGTVYLSAQADGLGNLERIFDMITGNNKHPAPSRPTGLVSVYEIIPHPGYPFTRIDGLKDLKHDGVETLMLNPSSSKSEYHNTTEVIGYAFATGVDTDRTRERIRKSLTHLSFR